MRGDRGLVDIASDRRSGTGDTTAATASGRGLRLGGRSCRWRWRRCRRRGLWLLRQQKEEKREQKIGHLGE
jgi:hypothetical protein